MAEALITVIYETRWAKIEKRSTAYDVGAETTSEKFEKEADRCIEYVSNVLQHKHGRAGANDPPAIRRPISNRQKVQLAQEIIDTAGLSNKEIVERIREALKR